MNVLARRVLRALGSVGAKVCGGAVLWACAAAASATYGPSARLDITVVPDSVTHSTAALPTFASYRLKITSLDRDRLKKFSFKGTVAVQGLPAGSTATATLAGAEGATCTLAAGVLECDIAGELSYPGKALAFTVTLQAPAAGTALDLAGKVTFFEYCCHWKHTDVATASTALIAPDADAFSTFVPASQTTPTTLFSGSQTRQGVVGAIPIVDSKAVPPVNDPFTTTVVVPIGSAATTASVAERELPQSCSANPRCFESDLTIPGSFDFLTIILRRDSTTLMSSGGHGHHGGHGKGHGKGRGHGHDDDDDGRYSGQSAIDNAIVKYFPDDDPAQPDRFIIVRDCSVVPGGVPAPKNPCIASRKAYPVPKKGHHHGTAAPTGLEGDWEFVIHALDNGRFQN